MKLDRFERLFEIVDKTPMQGTDHRKAMTCYQKLLEFIESNETPTEE